MAEAIRAGVVGAGFAAAAHVEALRRVPGVQVAGVAASTPERSAQAAARLGVARAFADFDELVASPDVDVVHDCAPNDLHRAVNEAALGAGKHLLSEKPLGVTSDETAHLTALAARAGVVTGVCHNYRHYPLVRHARELLASGEHGRPHLVHGSYLQDWLLHRDDWNWRLETERAGRSRAVADIGSHWIDLAQHVTGARVVRVCARLATLHRERLRPRGEVQTFASADDPAAEAVRVDTEDVASVLLELDDGATGALVVSQVSPGRKNRLWLQVDTRDVALAWDQEDPNRLWLGRRDAPNEQLMRDPSLLAPAAARLARYPGGHEEGWADGLRNLMEDFYGAVAAHARGRPYDASFATFAEADQVSRVVDAVLASDAQRAWVDVEGRVDG